MKSKLHQYCVDKLRKNLVRVYIQENYRPNWLKGDKNANLEIDIFLPEFKLAIECQGLQHYKFIEHFHGTLDGFKYQQARDALKRTLIKQQGLWLIEVRSEDDFEKITTYLKSSKRLCKKKLFVNGKERALRTKFKKCSELYAFAAVIPKSQRGRFGTECKKLARHTYLLCQYIFIQKTINSDLAKSAQKAVIYAEYALRKLRKFYKHSELLELEQFLVFAKNLKFQYQHAI